MLCLYCVSPAVLILRLSLLFHITHLHGQKEEVKIEVAAQDIFVGDCHEDTAAAVRQDGYGRAVGDGRSGRGSHCLWDWGGVEAAVWLSVAEFDGIISLFVVVVRRGHGSERVLFLGGRGCGRVGCKGGSCAGPVGSAVASERRIDTDEGGNGG